MNNTRKQAARWGWSIVIWAMIFAGGWGTVAQAQSENTLSVNVGESVTVAVDGYGKLAVADATVADVFPLTDKEFSVIGKKVGVTTLTVIRADKPTQIYRVDVGNDSAAILIRKLVNNPNISVRNIGDSLILDGSVNDEIEAQRALQTASAFKGQQVINLLEVRNPRQIRIRTRVAEVNNDAIKNMGFRWFGAAGDVKYALDYTGGGSILHGLVQPASAGGSGSDPTALDIGADVIVQLLAAKNYARLLSEPTLTTLSGKEASFLVGQEIPIVQQLPQSFTVEYKEVGVRMKIKPVADTQNQINTYIHAEVSQVIGLGQLGLPIIGSKKTESMLQVKDGQTIVIGGLLENQINRDFLRKVPWLADIPIFGFLFRQKEYGQQQREVLFFMTPEIVKPDDKEGAQTPMMRQWINQEAAEKVLEVPAKGYDWGLHEPGRMGIPEKKPTGAATPSAPAPEATAKPATEPVTNFTPARPSGQ
jgi:pilus assembly protein CpaC